LYKYHIPDIAIEMTSPKISKATQRFDLTNVYKPLCIHTDAELILKLVCNLIIEETNCRSKQVCPLITLQGHQKIQTIEVYFLLNMQLISYVKKLE
jgi:hypothetical protein